MAKVRVHELAKELNMSSRDLLTALAGLGVEAKSHSSSLNPETVDMVRATLKGNGGGTQTELPGIALPAQVTVRRLAELLSISTAEIQKTLVKQGALVAVNQVVAPELATRVAESFGYAVAPAEVREPEREKPKPRAVAATRVTEQPKRAQMLVPRAPIVTILGHVDHGKTTLLDAIRETKVTDQEFGGITQHIGAYQVEAKGRKITFLDTPGHEAFTAMRARGAQVTDIAVLVVAADDGVMPQTVEAIDHARAAGVQIIVAINKVDKPDANVDRTKHQLAEHELLVEEWGGNTVSVEVSAKEKKGLDDLLEMITLVAEMGELKADPSGAAEAVVIEARLDRGKGPLATVLLQQGVLKVGDAVIVGRAYGKIKAMLDDRGHRIRQAGPAVPVEILGLSAVPLAGDHLEVAKNEREARQIAESRIAEQREERLAAEPRVTLAELYKQLREGAVKDFNVILKTDVQGSEEAIRHSLEKLATEEVRVNLIHSGVGNIGESDVLLASASNAVVIGFNVKVEPQAQRAAEAEGVDVRTYRVIYELLEDIEAAMLGLLKPVVEESVVGHAEVRQLFKLPRGVAAGSYVTDGKALRGAEARVLRDGETICTSKVSSLKHFKEDLREMAAGFECGIMLEGFEDFQEGDVIEMFVTQEVARSR